MEQTKTLPSRNDGQISAEIENTDSIIGVSTPSISKFDDMSGLKIGRHYLVFLLDLTAKMLT